MNQEPSDKPSREDFPFYTSEEWALIQELSGDSDKESEAFQTAKNRFLDLLYHDLVEFYQWTSTPEDHLRIRKRFLNVAGLFFAVSIDEIREISQRAKLTHKRVVYEAPPNPLNGDLVEMHSYDLKYIPGFQEFFSQIVLMPNVTALDFISGNREKHSHPKSQLTVFRKRIQDEELSQVYLTATAEPLTQTQLISLYNEDGSKRDLISIGFDMIYESAFIDFFHTAPHVSPTSLLRNVNILAKNFLDATLTTITHLKNEKKDILETLPFFLFEENNKPEVNIDHITSLISQSFTAQVNKKIASWNDELGFDSDDESIRWDDDKIVDS